ncbi:hypothetical protein Q1695_014472 [Nippostrongylus brasiliensis]|nr:hypothetical protein Q1695_014472 [Nippostrongylus brasiliensis]
MGDLKAVEKHKQAPPRSTDWPAIKADWKKVSQFIQSKQYKQLTVQEMLVYTAVGLEVMLWFFVGEMIGRQYICG